MFPVSDVIPPKSTPHVTLALIAACTLTFVYGLQLEDHQRLGLARLWGPVPAELRWPALFTGLFLHDGWIHFASNMLFLWLFGATVEDTIGHASFLTFYLASGAAAALAAAALHPSAAAPVMGAGGAVAAVMAAYLVLYPQSQMLAAVFLVLYIDVIEVPALFFLGLWFVTQLAVGLAQAGARLSDAGPALAVQAIGLGLGAVTGAALRRRRRIWPPEPSGDRAGGRLGSTGDPPTT